MSNLFKRVYTKERKPAQELICCNTNKGEVYFDGKDFYNLGRPINPITNEIIYWFEESPSAGEKKTTDELYKEKEAKRVLKTKVENTLFSAYLTGKDYSTRSFKAWNEENKVAETLIKLISNHNQFTEIVMPDVVGEMKDLLRRAEETLSLEYGEENELCQDIRIKLKSLK